MSQERNGSKNTLVSYTRGNDLSGSVGGAGGIGGLLARSSGYSGGNFTAHNYYFADGNGKITCMLDNSPAKVASYRYDPFGNIVSSSGTLASANVYRFSSKEIHANSGMYYYGYRFYDSNLQRWINRDPLGDTASQVNPDSVSDEWPAESWNGINLYTFVGNRVNNFYDADGTLGTPAENVALVLALGEEEAAEIIGAAAARAAAQAAATAAGAGVAAAAGAATGAIICEARGRGERGIQGTVPNPWKGWKPNPDRPGWGWKRDPQTGQKVPKPRPPGPAPKNHPNW